MKKGSFVGISELARCLGISRVAVYKKIIKKEIEAEKIGNIYLIPKSYISTILGTTLNKNRKRMIELAIRKTIKEYGEVLEMLGNE